MNLEKLKKFLESEGWAISLNQFGHGVDWYAWKRFEGFKDCLCNERPPSVCIKPAKIELKERVYYAASIEVIGEVSHNNWINFQFYSLSFEEIKKDREKLVNKLRVAWNSVCESEDTANINQQDHASNRV